MKIINPYVYINSYELDEKKVDNIEYCARLCYKSENKACGCNSANFLQSIIKNGHESVIEHEKITAFFVVDRGVSHEIVRHRIASFSQESTRYCNYSSDKFENEITVIKPFFYKENSQEYEIWKKACLSCEDAYIKLTQTGSPQQARSILPNSLKTEIAVTLNFRQWRHFLKLRAAADAHPQIQQVSIPLLMLLKNKFPVLFESVPYNENFDKEDLAEIIIK